MQADPKVCDDTVMCAGAPLYRSVILLRQQSFFLPGYPQLLAQPTALLCRLVLPASGAQTVAGRRRNPLATRALQHEPNDKNKRSSNATGRREAGAAAAQMRYRERAARNSHEREEANRAGNQIFFQILSDITKS